MTGTLERALAYAARDWPVFPVEVRGKRPLGRLAPRGLHDAALDVETISRWWELEPSANVAIATGAVSGLAVIDVDGHRGRESLLALQRRWGQLPKTLWVRTARGWHAYFQHPGVNVSSTSGKLAPGLDVRGDGGYVIAPPSLHLSGERYRWHNPETDPAPLPRWLLAALDPPRRVSPWSLVRDRNHGSDRLGALVRFVASQPVGNRNSALFWASCRAAEEGCSSDEAGALLLDAARACGLEEREALRTIRSATVRTSR